MDETEFRRIVVRQFLLPIMEQPNVRSSIRDEENNVTYHVMAYRELTRAELVGAVRMYRSQPRFRRRKTPEKNKIITIISVIGCQGD